MLSSASSSTGVNARKNGDEAADRRRARGTRSCERVGELGDERRLALGSGSGERGEQRRRERRLEVALREPRQPVLERDRLALLGHLEPARRLALRLREDRRVRRPAAAARRCRRARGRR